MHTYPPALAPQDLTAAEMETANELLTDALMTRLVGPVLLASVQGTAEVWPSALARHCSARARG